MSSVSGVKTCCDCKAELPRSAFRSSTRKHANGRTYHQVSGYCRPCEQIRNGRWRAANVEKVKALVRKTQLLTKFGLTPGQYDNMLRAQSGRCALCASPPVGKRLAVDHCHATGRIRGLLCDFCNRGLGLFKDNAGALRSAAKYLEWHRVA